MHSIKNTNKLFGICLNLYRFVNLCKNGKLKQKESVKPINQSAVMLLEMETTDGLMMHDQKLVGDR